MAKKQQNKKHILFRFGLITLLLMGISIAVLVKLFKTTVIDREAWNKAALKQLEKIDTIAPERGSILSSNGSILACNVLVWDFMLDLRHAKIAGMDELPWASLDSLADYLDATYPRPANLNSMPADSIKKYSWRARFRREFAKAPNRRNRCLFLAKGATITEFEELGEQPFIKLFYGKRNSPYYKQSRFVRKQPYGSMARYSIGLMYQDPERRNQWHGYSGLEKDLDSLLYGRDGYAKRVAMTSGVGNWNTSEPVKGYDVVTTIDIAVQDIFEQEMTAMCAQANAEWGTGLIMDVATGAIVAISNMERRPDGSGYAEAYNRTVACFEPGSVIKPVSLLIGFEDGLIHSNGDRVDTSPFQQTNDPHAPTIKTIPEVMAWSSNTGVSRIIFRGYAQDPSKYYDRWKSLGLLEKMHTGIAEEQIPRISRLNPENSKGQPITMTARHLSLARQAYGYALEISPLYLLSVYNAIANDGRYVRPHLVRALRDAEGRDSIIHHAPIREQICSPRTAKMLRECLHEVVWGAGTGRAVRDDRVEIAGKTGTAFPVFEKGKGSGYDKSRRRYAFAGFFPYDNPRYSCMVLMLAPAHSGSAASLSGGVMRNTAVRMYARGLLEGGANYADKTSESIPVLASGNKESIKRVKKDLKVKSARSIKVAPADKSTGAVPDMRGYDAATAVATLERMGLNVRLEGSGRVVAQMPESGTRLRHGDIIRLNLK